MYSREYRHFEPVFEFQVFDVTRKITYKNLAVWYKVGLSCSTALKEAGTQGI